MENKNRYFRDKVNNLSEKRSQKEKKTTVRFDWTR